jgi:hypothetical protein
LVVAVVRRKGLAMIVWDIPLLKRAERSPDGPAS